MIENLSDQQLADRLDMAERRAMSATTIADMRLWNGIVQQIIDEQARRDLATQSPDRPQSQNRETSPPHGH